MVFVRSSFHNVRQIPKLNGNGLTKKTMLYDQQIKIITSPTYLILNLILEQTTLKVKIPITATELITKYLLHKAIYYYYLDKKHLNPLFKVAQIVYFQSRGNFNFWYQLWATGDSIPKYCQICCVGYCDQLWIGKYVPLTVLERLDEGYNVLGRSRKDGRYYEICIYNHNKIRQEKVITMYQNYKNINHQFISRLHEIYRYKNESYLIFDHNPYKIKDIIEGQRELELVEVKNYCMELMLGLILLEQQHVMLKQIGFQMIDVNVDGHLVINWKMLSCFEEYLQGEFGNNFGKFVMEFYDVLMAKVGEIEEEEKKGNQNFRKYLSQLAEKKRASLKQLLTHPWIQSINIQNILSKSGKVYNVQNLNKKFCYQKLNEEENQLLFGGYGVENYWNQKPLFYQSCEMYSLSRQEIVFHKYLPIKETNVNSSYFYQRLTKVNTSASKLTKQRVILKQSIHNRNLINKQRGTKSPYFSELVKYD